MARTLQEWLDYIEQQHPRSIEMGLERTHEAARRLSLDKPAAHVVTVGGTNGKGSTVAFIEAIARAAGLKVGAYTSPHLLRYNERVRIDGREASDEELIQAFEAVEAARLSPSPIGRGVGERVRRSVDSPDHGQTPSPPNPPLEGEGSDIPLTYFEFGTLAALWLFQQSNLDLAVLEVGLGGRLDAVNIVDPDVAVITTVDIDHVDWLGNDRESIGFEKAGIARAWKPLVLGEVDPPSSVLRHAYAIGANAVRAGSDYLFERLDDTRWQWREVGFELEMPLPALVAPSQLANAAAAIATLRALPIDLPEAAFVEGIRIASLPARLQRVTHRGVDVWIDVGHNLQAARELAGWLGSQATPGTTHAVFAALGDKDMAGIVAVLAPHIGRWWLAGLAEAGARGLDIQAFATRLQGTAAADGHRHADVAIALDAALDRAGPGDRILVFGSFFAASAALRVLHAG